MVKFICFFRFYGWDVGWREWISVVKYKRFVLLNVFMVLIIIMLVVLVEVG